MKFELLKLLEKGLPYEVIPELEQSEFNDWIAASRALDIDNKLRMMNIVSSPHMKQNDRAGLFNGLQTEQAMLLGDNPFAVDEDAVLRTREKLKASGKVRRPDGSTKGNSCQAKA